MENIVQLVMNRLNAGQRNPCRIRSMAHATYVGDVSSGVQHLVENAANGIFHICGEECLTIAEIAFQVADYMKLDCSLVHPATTEEMQEATPPSPFQWNEHSKSPDYTWLPATKAERHPHGVETLTANPINQIVCTNESMCSTQHRNLTQASNWQLNKMI